MILPDVNVLVYAQRRDAADHEAYRGWLAREIAQDAPFGLSDIVLSAFVRVVTNARIFKSPTELADAIAFADNLRAQPNCIVVNPGARHWDIFRRLCLETNASGDLVPDAYFAALAIESGSEWITTDGDFRRFPGLRWRHPLSG